MPPRGVELRLARCVATGGGAPFPAVHQLLAVLWPSSCLVAGQCGSLKDLSSDAAKDLCIWGPALLLEEPQGCRIHSNSGQLAQYTFPPTPPKKGSSPHDYGKELACRQSNRRWAELSALGCQHIPSLPNFAWSCVCGALKMSGTPTHWLVPSRQLPFVLEAFLPGGGGSFQAQRVSVASRGSRSK